MRHAQAQQTGPLMGLLAIRTALSTFRVVSPLDFKLNGLKDEFHCFGISFSCYLYMWWILRGVVTSG